MLLQICSAVTDIVIDYKQLSNVVCTLNALANLICCYICSILVKLLLVSNYIETFPL